MALASYVQYPRACPQLLVSFVLWSGETSSASTLGICHNLQGVSVSHPTKGIGPGEPPAPGGVPGLGESDRRWPCARNDLTLGAESNIGDLQILPTHFVPETLKPVRGLCVLTHQLAESLDQDPHFPCFWSGVFPPIYDFCHLTNFRL